MSLEALLSMIISYFLNYSLRQERIMIIPYTIFILKTLDDVSTVDRIHDARHLWTTFTGLMA